MKYIVVGTSHSGYEVIQTLLKEDENADIQVFESADQPSFLSCEYTINKTNAFKCTKRWICCSSIQYTQSGDITSSCRYSC